MKNWHLLFMVTALVVISSGTIAVVFLSINKTTAANLLRNQQAACERGNILRHQLTLNAQANRDGWKLARQARLAAAAQATDRTTIEINTTAAEGYRAIVGRLLGIEQIDCRSVIK